MTDSRLIDECADDIIIDNAIVQDSSRINFQRAHSRKCIPMKYSKEK